MIIGKKWIGGNLGSWKSVGLISLQRNLEFLFRIQEGNYYFLVFVYQFQKIQFKYYVGLVLSILGKLWVSCNLNFGR